MSARARRLRLSVTARDGLVVTLPRGVPHAAARDAVVTHARWAQRGLDRVADRRALYTAGPDALLPDTVELLAVGVTLPVEYRHTGATSCSARERGGLIVVSGPVDDAQACLRALGRWRDRAARERLPGMLACIASELGVSVSCVSVRAQRSRWGSYSGRGTISLNRNLVFLPAEFATWVMAHELVHMSQPGHSPAFWREMRRVRPDTDEIRRAMRHAAEIVPPWAEL
ncbi:MAG: SprT family zinc-dependent metalloprotease [Actinomycetota bacterium]|nr:SprT family zinc-dependent metalloprotease [Actinomycetota bacterium]